jgi:hypothetical protein
MSCIKKQQCTGPNTKILDSMTHISFYIHKVTTKMRTKCEGTVADKVFIPLLTVQKASTPKLTAADNIQCHNLPLFIQPWNGTVDLNVTHKICWVLQEMNK